MNSPFMHDQSRAWAEQLLSGSGDSQANAVPAIGGTSAFSTITRAYLQAYSRPPSQQEINRAAGYLEQYDKQLAQMEMDANKRKVETWQSFCHAIFASSEFRFLD
jgi:hypothetical protein